MCLNILLTTTCLNSLSIGQKGVLASNPMGDALRLTLAVGKVSLSLDKVLGANTVNFVR